MAFISYAVAIPVAFFANNITVLLFSSAYADAGPLLAVLIWSGVFTNLIAARNLFIVAKNWTRVNLVSIALGCALNIVLNIILIPRFEAMGAVIATFVSYWFTAHVTCFFFKSLNKTGMMITKALLYPKVW
jgi:O-antigen/teichoic acid export membrane protein